MCLKKKPGTFLQASAIRQDAHSYSSTLIGRLISIFLILRQTADHNHTYDYSIPLSTWSAGAPSPTLFRLSFLEEEPKDMAGHSVEPLPHQEECAAMVKAAHCNTVVWGKINMHFFRGT